MGRFSRSILICTLAMGLSLSAEATRRQNTPPDNTKVNKRDRGTALPTAGDQQKGTRSDVEITRLVRLSITKDKALSTYAKNIKIITQKGIVTLRGPVRSEEEKKSIEAKATDVAGVNHVKNEIEIAAKKQNR